MEDNPSSAPGHVGLTAELYSKLEALYLNPSLPSGFSSVEGLYKASKGISGVTRSLIRRFLASQPSYSRFRPRRRRFKRRPFVSFAINRFWQADLLDVSTIARQNSGINFILVIIDTLSGYVRFQGLKKKSAELTAEGFRKVFEAEPGLTVKYVVTDHGTEFWNRNVISELERRDAILISTQNFDIKAAAAERCCRTLKNRIVRFINANNTFRYIDELQRFAESINGSVNRMIGMAPKDVTTANQNDIFYSRYGYKKGDKGKEYTYGFSEGDIVRTALPRRAFQKESHQQFSNTLHRVEEARSTHPHTFRISVLDSKGDSIGELEKAFYSPELSLVLNPDFGQLTPRPIPRRNRPLI